MKLYIVTLCFLLSSCSHMKFEDFKNLATGKDTRAIEAWKELPKVVSYYVEEARDKGKVDSLYVNKTFSYIYNNGTCYGKDGSKQSSATLCKELLDLNEQLKEKLHELNKFYQESPRSGLNVSSRLEICSDTLEDFDRISSSNVYKSRHIEEWKECKRFLEKQIPLILSKIEGIKEHTRAKDMGLHKFDPIRYISPTISHGKVKALMENAAEVDTKPLLAKTNKDDKEEFINNYCMMLIAYKSSNKVIMNAPTYSKMKDLLNDKEELAKVLPKLRENYTKKYGEKLTEESCRNHPYW